MRRIVIIAIVLVATCGAAVAVVATLHATTRAAATPLNPARGDPAATTQAALLAAPLDRFGLALLADEARDDSGNVVISPLSIHAVLSLLLNGATGQTATEMRRALALDGLTLPATNQAWADLIASAQAGGKPAVEIADSLWLRDGVAFNPAFLNAARAFYAAGTQPLPTDPSKAAGAVNDWVAQRTNDLIKQIVQPGYFTDQTILTVVNTVHVKADWRVPFAAGATHAAPFTLADGSTVSVPTMNGPVSGPVAQTPSYDAVALATKGQVTAWVVVPRSGQTPESLLAQFQRSGLDALYRGARTAQVMLDLPRLHTAFSSPDLKPELEALGMISAFSPSQAELQGIVAPGTQGRVYIQRVVHKAVLNVNETGVEAAAATAALVAEGSAPFAPLTIRADHPFLLLLTDKTTAAPLFMALIRDPRS